MRATLPGGLLLVLLVLLALLATGVVDPALRSPETAAAPASQAPQPASPATTSPPIASPPATPVEQPSVLAAGELSVLETDAPEPMVRYVDSEGSIRMVRGLARVPAAQRADAVVLRSDNVNLVNVPNPTAVAFRDWQPAANPNRHEVVLFSAPWCSACEHAKRYLDRRRIRYEERDIESDDSARQEVLRILGQIAIPLLEVNGRYISGFRPEVYDRALP
jgi:glutaredoxin-like protein NrdH